MTNGRTTPLLLRSTLCSVAAFFFYCTSPAHAAFVAAPSSTVAEATRGASGPIKILVVGVGADGQQAAGVLRKTLRGAPGISLVMGGEALGSLDGLDDFKVFKRARRMPVDRVAVLRVYPQGDEQPAMAIAAVYNRDGKTVSTVTFKEDAPGGVAAPPPPKRPRMPKPETDGLPKATPTSSTSSSAVKAPPRSPAPGPKKEQRYSILVIDPVDTDLSGDIRVAVAGRMAAELSTVRRFDVMTAADIRAMTALEATRQLAGCNDESCLSEVADALGADLVVSWDVSNIGSKRIITTRLFDANNAKTIGRSQAEAASDEDLPQQAATALRTTTDQFLRSLLDSSLSRREEYEEKFLSVGTTGLFGNLPAYYVGRQRVPMSRLEFLLAAGEVEKAEDFEGSQAVMIFALIAGVPLAVIGATIGVIGSFVNLVNPGIGITMMVIGGLTVALALGPLLLAAFIAPQDGPVEEDRAIAEKHNRRLRRKLGLPENASIHGRAAPLAGLIANSLVVTAF